MWINRVLVVAFVVAAGCASGSSETSPDVERGQQLAVDLGCASCHSADGTTRLGPSWAGSWGTDVELDDGSRIVFDEEYVERSVRDPGAERRAGSWLQMPPFGPARLPDDDLAAIVAYLRSLADER